MPDTKNWTQLFPMDRKPSVEELDQYADNPLWPELRQYLKDAYGAEPGWTTAAAAWSRGGM